MRKLFQLLFVVAFVSALLTSCKQDEVCLRCTITIAGIEEVKPQTCDDLETINALEAEYQDIVCLLYTSPSPRDATLSRMPSSA